MRMIRAWKLIGLVFIGAVSSLPDAFARKEHLAVSASTAPHYDRRVPGSDRPREETYAFMQGRYFAGNSRDESLDTMTFETIIRTLAPHLAEQGYRPAPKATEADLVLMVHWGVTQTYQHHDAVLATDQLNQSVQQVIADTQQFGIAYTGNLHDQLADREMSGQLLANAMRNNARLLGYNVAVDESFRSMLTDPQRLLLKELSEERYFIIVMAYDYRALREKKTRDVLWITRLSMRSPGNNFREALPTLARAGGDFFGKRETDLRRVRATVVGSNRTATTEIGELQVISSTPESP